MVALTQGIMAGEFFNYHRITPTIPNGPATTNNNCLRCVFQLDRIFRRLFEITV
jgi:hypothetical protein